MLFSLNLLETFPLYIINIFFFLIFFSVLLLSYPTGRYFLTNHCENSIVKCSLFSIVIFATAVSIVTNFAPIFAKYVIIIFYLTNLFILVISSKIRKDLLKAVISFRLTLLFVFVIFLAINEIFKVVFIENNELVYFFNSHDPYFFDPIAEILTSDYFSRLKILSLYPLEWSAYHFFEASFNSIFLSPIYQSGTIGLLVLKNFYFSIFLILFIFSFFNNGNFKKEKPLQVFLKVSIVILLFVSLFLPKVTYFILTKNFISTLSIIFIIQSLLSNNKKEFLLWVIILSLSSFRNIFISVMFFVYYLIESQHFNFTSIIHKIKRSLNLPNLILMTLFLLYLIATFYQNEVVASKFHLLGDKPWWFKTTTYMIIDNYKYFISIFIFLIIIYLFLLKYFFKEELYISSFIKKQDFFYLSLVFIVPFICIILLIFKNQIASIYNIEKLNIFFDSFILKNLSYYFFVPLIWCLILFCSKILVRNIFLITIIIHTFLSIFIYNGISLPAFFALEIMILFYISHILLDINNYKKKNALCYLFIASIVVSSVFSPNIYYKSITNYNYKNTTKFVFKIKDLKELKKRKYLCSQEAKHMNPNENIGRALSVILVKPYYADIFMVNKYGASRRWGQLPKKQIINPCTNE